MLLAALLCWDPDGVHNAATLSWNINLNIIMYNVQIFYSKQASYRSCVCVSKIQMEIVEKVSSGLATVMTKDSIANAKSDLQLYVDIFR